MNMPTVFFYNLDNPRGREIKRLCLPLKLKVVSVKPEEFGETLAALTGVEEKKGDKGEGVPFTDEMLVMSGLSNGQMNTFLTDIRRKKIPPVALKAVITKTNVHWTSIELHQELQKEHEAMKQGMSAHQ